ncbi:LysE/ArgO family amino acid transporter [Brevibacterium litoralis]|uniref:LysE/ArgO family amino acid transporter n=1 Tax=Brevibacterium litoralis TaxID=3138935 RepID=UPI0032ED8126
MHSLTIALTGFVAGLVLYAAVGAQTVFMLRQGARGARMFPLLVVAFFSDLVLTLLGIMGTGALISRHPGFVTIITVVGVLFLVGYGALSLRKAFRSDRDADGSEILDLDEVEPAGSGATAGTVLTDSAAAEAPAARIPAHAGAPAGAQAGAGAAAVGTGDGGGRGASGAGEAGGVDPVGADADGAEDREAARTVRAPFITWSMVLTVLGFTCLNPQAYLDVVVVLGSMSSNYADALRWVFTAGVIVSLVAWLAILGVASKGMGKLLLKYPKAWRTLDLITGILMIVLAGVLASHLL